MAKLGRPPKAAKDVMQPITILIPPVERQALEAQAKAEGVGISQIARRRLAQAVDTDALSPVEKLIPPRVRAVGWLTAFLLNELTGYGQPQERAEFQKIAIGRILDRTTAAKLDDPQHEAEMIADYWWLRMNNAYERTYRGGAPMPKIAQERALIEIRRILGPQNSKPRKRVTKEPK